MTEKPGWATKMMSIQVLMLVLTVSCNLIVALSLGAIGGFGSGIASIAYRCHHGAGWRSHACHNHHTAQTPTPDKTPKTNP